MTIDTLPDDDTRWDESTTSSLDVIFKAFSEPIRREAVILLRRESDPISVRELAERLSGETDRMHVALIHVHLPMLDTVGIVDWNPVRESVEFGDTPSRYDELFDVVGRSVR